MDYWDTLERHYFTDDTGVHPLAHSHFPKEEKARGIRIKHLAMTSDE